MPGWRTGVCARAGAAATRNDEARGGEQRDGDVPNRFHGASWCANADVRLRSDTCATRCTRIQHVPCRADVADVDASAHGRASWPYRPPLSARLRHFVRGPYQMEPRGRGRCAAASIRAQIWAIPRIRCFRAATATPATRYGPCYADAGHRARLRASSHRRETCPTRIWTTNSQRGSPMPPTVTTGLAGVDRRAFLMRSAVIGAAAVIAGCAAPTPRADGRHRDAAARAARRPPGLAGPRGREEVEGAGDDDARRVLQGRARALELAHHRPDAHHLRLLPALHEAAGRPAREGHRPEGAPVRQPERDRQGPRHRARRAGRHHRQGAGDRRARVPRRPARAIPTRASR